jgi:EmrB/QacA subfamily drug resistance transporter
VLVLAVGLGTFSVLQSMVAPLLPTLQRDLHTSQNTITWVLTAYLLAASVATPILGRLGDRYGKDRMLVVSLAALATGAALAAAASSIGLMIAARAIQGIGGGTVPLAFGIVRDERDPERVGPTVGFLAALLGAGGGIGIVIAGPLNDAVGYQWLFAGAAVMTTAALAVALLFVPPSPVRAPGQIGMVAPLLLSATLICLLLGISEASSWGWGSSAVLALVGSGLAFGLAWMRAELRSPNPLIDMRMMRLPTVWTTNLVSFVVGAAMYCAVAFLPQFVQTAPAAGYGFGASVTESGMILVPQAAVMFIAGSSSGPVIARFGGRAVMLVACSLIGASLLWFALSHGTVVEFIFSTLFMGAGVGLSFAGMTTLVVQAVSIHQTGAASGMNANIRTMGGAIGASLISLVVTSGRDAASGFPSEAGYRAGFFILAALMFIGAAVSMRIPRLARPDDPVAWRLGRAHPEVSIAAGAAALEPE